jgi:hypothetical protein
LGFTILERLEIFFSEKEHFCAHPESLLFIAYTNHDVVGRIATIINHRFCETTVEKVWFFGFFSISKILSSPPRY